MKPTFYLIYRNGFKNNRCYRFTDNPEVEGNYLTPTEAGLISKSLGALGYKVVYN